MNRCEDLSAITFLNYSLSYKSPDYRITALTVTIPIYRIRLLIRPYNLHEQEYCKTELLMPPATQHQPCLAHSIP